MVKLNGLNGESACMGNGDPAWGASPFAPFRFAIQTVQFVTPMQIETFPIYIKLDQHKLLEKFLKLSHSC